MQQRAMTGTMENVDQGYMRIVVSTHLSDQMHSSWMFDVYLPVSESAVNDSQDRASTAMLTMSVIF